MIKTKLNYTSFKIAPYAEPEATGKNVKIVFSHDPIHREELVLTGLYRYVMLNITNATSLTALNECWGI